jgi:hypothetical protein
VGKTKSKETREKISASVKASHQRRKLENNPIAKRKRELAANFQSGHPDGLAPSVIRSSGDVERLFEKRFEAKPTIASLPEHVEQSPQVDNSGIRRAESWRSKVEGERGGKIRPPKHLQEDTPLESSNEGKGRN